MENIQELIKKRKKFAEAIEENNYDLSTVLVGLYADPSHFIYEILQNAEDCEASEISFDLYDDKLVIKHNGKDFNENDIETITAIALKENEKKDQNDKIGRFGIGFKSVYAITSNPHIQSGKYDFVITQFVLPNDFSDNNSYKETIITLPFDHNLRSKAEIYEMIFKKLESFEIYNLLFLSNLKSISFIYNNQKEIITRKSVKYKNSDFAEKVTLSLNGNKIEYLMFKSEVKHADFQKLVNKQYCAVAFQINEAGEIIKSDTSNLFVFFETGYETYLNFLIQAPFITTPARDNINTESSLNIELIEEINDLVVKTLRFFSDNNLVTIGFLEQLPLENPVNEKGKVIYKKVFDTVKSELKIGRSYIPTITPENIKPVNEVALVRGRELISILSSVEDLEELFGIKYWVNTEITTDKTPKLYNYFRKELEIAEYGPEEFARRTTKEYFERKPDSWVMKLYEFLNGRQESLWRAGSGSYEGVLRRKPFIRLENGQHKQPFDEKGRPAVFLPFDGNKLDFDIIKNEVIKSKASSEFIKDKLGIQAPNIFDEIKYQILPQYSRSDSNVSYDLHVQHMAAILEFYNNTGDYYKQELKRLITEQRLKLFIVKDNQSDTVSYQNYINTYLYDERLKNYFRFTNKIFFLDLDKYKALPFDQFITFCKDLSIVDYPRIFSFDPKFDYNKKRFLRENSAHYDKEITTNRGETIIDYKLHGLNDIINNENFNVDDSVLIWEIICRRISKRSNRVDYEKGRYEWFYKYERATSFTSNYILNLREKKWLYLKDDKENPSIPSEIMLTDLADDYEITSEAGLNLVEILNFKQDDLINSINQIPEEFREPFVKFATALELSREKGVDFKDLLDKAIATLDQIDLKDEIENAPELSEVDVKELPYEKFDNSNLDVNEEASDSNDDEKGQENGDNKENKSKPIPTLSQEAKNKIGERGEKIAFSEYLKKKYSATNKLIAEEENKLIFEEPNGNQIEIIHLNADTLKQGTGCDIIIKRADEIIEYIEVKSTETDSRTLYQVTGNQWALAHRLFNEKRGNDYKIFVVRKVFDINPTVTEIVNPIRLWKDGLLKAHPVNFEL